MVQTVAMQRNQYRVLKKHRHAAKAGCTVLLRDNKLPCHSRSQVKYFCFDYKVK